MTGLPAHRVSAYNTSKHSENKIHDDHVARRFGFTGGLVPGVEVYAYMTHLPAVRWGGTWLDRGTAECRLLRPVYDGDTVTVSASETADGFDIALESRGEVCATGRASLPAGPVSVPPAFAAAPVPPDPPAERPQADEASMPVGKWFAIHPFRVGADDARQYLRDVRESLPLYQAEQKRHAPTVTSAVNA